MNLIKYMGILWRQVKLYREKCGRVLSQNIKYVLCVAHKLAGRDYYVYFMSVKDGEKLRFSCFAMQNHIPVLHTENI